jgi:hypothetical protein
MELLVKNTMLYMVLKSLEPKRISQGLKLHFSKRGLSWVDEVKKFQSFNKCGFCGSDVIGGDELLYKLDEENATIELIGASNSTAPFYCANKGCPGKSLNANSIEFVKTAYNVDADEALAIIHLRNKSPFYACNHKTSEEYAEYQGRLMRTRKAEMIKKQNHSRSLDGYIEKYGKDDGPVKWKMVQSLKANTLEHFIKKIRVYRRGTKMVFVLDENFE